MPDNNSLIDLTAEVVAAYVSSHTVVTSDLPGLIAATMESLQQAAAKSTQPSQTKQEPAVAIKRSVKPDHITCIDCGKKFKSLKRHIRTNHGLTPDEYRQKWALSYDYPMVAPNYAAARSQLAKKIGLGRKR